MKYPGYKNRSADSFPKRKAREEGARDAGKPGKARRAQASEM